MPQARQAVYLQVPGSCKRSAQKHDRTSLVKTEHHIQDFLATSSGKRFKGWKQEKTLYAPRFTTDHRQSLQQQGWTCVDLMNYRTWLCS